MDPTPFRSRITKIKLPPLRIRSLSNLPLIPGVLTSAVEMRIPRTTMLSPWPLTGKAISCVSSLVSRYVKTSHLDGTDTHPSSCSWTTQVALAPTPSSASRTSRTWPGKGGFGGVLLVG